MSPSTIKINDTSLTRARWIASILPEAKKYNQKIKYIDLRWEDSYYLRLQGEKEAKKPETQQLEKPQVAQAAKVSEENVEVEAKEIKEEKQSLEKEEKQETTEQN